MPFSERRREYERWSLRLMSLFPEDVERTVAETGAHFGRIDLLFNNAGINMREQTKDLALEDWQKVLSVNLTSAFLDVEGRISGDKESRRRQDREYREHGVGLRLWICGGLCVE